ncbi:hypothetical protein BH23PAT1_BH23PAT1_4710 [soil metagenome]
MAAIDIKRLFIATTANMSWRLALIVIVPTVGGIHLDRRLGTTPSLTLAGFMLAIAGGCMVVWSAVKEINSLQAEEELKRTKLKKRSRKTKDIDDIFSE